MPFERDTPRYLTMALGDLLDAFAASEPTPGGGSAAALTGSLGMSLLLMVAGMSRTRTGSPEETADLSASAARLRLLREELIALIDDDSRAYADVLAAYRHSKATAGESVARLEAIDTALRAATEIPLRTMRLCEQALREAPVITRFGNPNARTDAVVGARLLLAAVESAGSNVDTNLPGIQDPEYARASAEERRSLQTRAAQFVGQLG